MSKQNAKTVADGEVITGMAAGARFCGLSKPTFAKHVDKIPHRRLDRRIIFTRRALLSWLEGGGTAGEQ